MRISDWSSDVCASDLCSYQRDALYKIAPPRLNYRSRHQMDASPLRKLLQGLRRATSDSFATRRAMKTSLMARGRISATRSEEHTYEIQSLMHITYAVFCCKKKKTRTTQ